MKIIPSGISKDEIILPNNQKVIIDYMTDLRTAGTRKIYLYDEKGKLIGSTNEKNPHKVKLPQDVLM
jgi:hypothetical protein